MDVQDQGKFCKCSDTCKKCNLSSDGDDFECTECLNPNFLTHEDHCVEHCPNMWKKLKDDLTLGMSCVQKCPPEKQAELESAENVVECLTACPEGLIKPKQVLGSVVSH